MKDISAKEADKQAKLFAVSQMVAKILCSVIDYAKQDVPTSQSEQRVADAVLNSLKALDAIKD